jgi:hypothetical protein
MRLLLNLLLLLLLAGCEKNALTTASDSVKRPVVEGYFSPNQIPKVKITYQLAFGSTDTIVQSIKDLSVTVNVDGVSYPMAYSDLDTAYVGDGSWQVIAGKQYQLQFAYGDGMVSATSQVPLPPDDFAASATSIAVPQFSGNPGSGGPPSFPDPVTLTWENNDGAYYLVVVENVETDPELISDNTDSDRPPRPVFRSEPEQSNTYEIGFQSFEYFGTHRIILFRLNAEYASLYSDNGNSSQNLTSPYSNILGGLGIFTGINSDTLTLEVTK